MIRIIAGMLFLFAVTGKKHLCTKGAQLVMPLLHLVTLYLTYELVVMVFDWNRVTIFFFKEWDAFWYADIAGRGYLFFRDRPSNSGFFPFFPYMWKALWKITGSGVEGVCAVNTLLFFSGMLVLKQSFRFS